MNRKVRNILIIAAAGGFCVFGCCGSLMIASRQKVGLGVSRGDCPAQHRIPKNAKNINYTYIAWGPSIQLEYDLTEHDFLAWCQSEGWVVIETKDRSVFRPSAFTGGTGSEVLVSEAFTYAHTYPGDDGAGYSVVYDRTNQRVYYNESGH